MHPSNEMLHFQMCSLIFVLILFYLLLCNLLKSSWKTFPMLNLENIETTPKQQTFSCDADMSDNNWRPSVPTFHLARLCLACSDWWENSLRQWEFRYSPFLLCLSHLFERWSKPHTACCIVCEEINSLDSRLKHPIILLCSFIILL